MATLKRGMSYELLAKTPGLSFPSPTTPVSLSRICAEVFGGSDPLPKMTKAEVEDNICEFLTECDNHFHSLTICPIHHPLASACVCQEKMNYKHIASSLEKSWARPIDPSHVKAIVEATLSARVEVINENNGIKNDIKGAKSLILLNVHILLCIFAEFKHSHDCSLVNSLTWNITGAIDQKQEAQERKKMLLRQRKAKKAKSVPGAGDPSTADAAVAEESKTYSHGRIAALRKTPFLSKPISQRSMHTTENDSAKPMNPDPRENPAHELTLPRGTNVGRKRFSDFELAGKVFVVTGGAQGLGLTLAESLVEAGGKVYCLDRADQPDEGWHEAQARVVPEWGGSLHYRKQDVSDAEGLDKLITAIADENRGIDGVIAAAGVQHISPTVEYDADEVAHMLSINYTGVFMTAKSAAKQMMKYKKRGSICLIASISGLKANRGLVSPVYNSSKAAVIQLARNLAMEWSPIQKDGTGGIRVNCISPGHIMTPMVQSNFEEVPGMREEWEREIIMGRLAETQEFKGAALFLLSNASSYMTGNNLVIDGGHTSW
ncbi:hypothetical protein FPRO05_11932 [Fusarium proliferatum]|uniref:D-arabinitol 2-dehydrogenase n=1 Tax=Gibberella intermedia TaxID=948311 RepID=A0A365N5W4_GIBIN|nr:hypothetical protein FPRO05_11932 [Fusarium proliferatum]